MIDQEVLDTAASDPMSPAWDLAWDLVFSCPECGTKFTIADHVADG